MEAERVAAEAPFRLLGHLDLGDQAAGCRIPPGTRCRLLSGPDCVPRRTRRDIPPEATGRRRARRRRRCRPARSPAPHVRDRSAPPARRPTGQYALDVVLPQPDPVVVPGGTVADIQRGPDEPCDLGYLSLRKEPIGDAALNEDLDGA